jgi:alcohol dehydrogenase
LKVAIGGVLLYPTIALCDPDLTAGLPPALTASTGMDALAHAIECYTNRACQPISASLALRAIELIGKHLRGATLDGRTDRQSRAAMLLGSTMAGMAMNSTRLGLAHALAMPLGSWGLKIPHSIAIAVTLPLVMEFNHSAAPERFAAVARALGECVGGSPADAARRAAPAVAHLAEDIGIPKGLSEFGLRDEHVADVIEEAMKSGNVAVNPRSTSREELTEILRQALGPRLRSDAPGARS